jgi:hypothetical protein
MINQDFLAPKHEGMRISAEGLLGRIVGGKRVDKMDRFCLGELLKHMNELGKRFYAGDIKTCDEFLQLYCCDDDRPKEVDAGQELSQN